MRYRLKDRDLQRKLDSLTDNDFSRALAEGIDPTDFFREFSLCGVGTIGLYLRDEAFEEVVQYDPTKWNEWPRVTPPNEVRMRVEVLTKIEDEGTPDQRGGKVRYRGCASFFQGFWLFGKDKCSLNSGETVRFRPWEDKE